MAGKGKKFRRFGAVRQYRSGRWTASYIAPDGQRQRAPGSFNTKTDAEIWLSQVEADPRVGTGGTLTREPLTSVSTPRLGWRNANSPRQR